MSRNRAGTAAKYTSAVAEGDDSTHGLALALTGHDRRVLELGCATGHVTAALKARGHHVVGVEIDPASGEVARGVADKVVIADLDAVDLADVVTERDFDIALMGDVLEHLRDPLTVLREVVGVLADDGFAVISVPNVAYADVRLALLDGTWKYYDDGLLDRTHLRFFTRTTLFELVEQAGLVVTELRRFVRPPCFSNVRLTAPVLGTAVDDLVARAPEATTYVFVVKAERPTPDAVGRSTRLAAELAAADEAALAALQVDVERRMADRLQLEQDRRELDALRRTKLMRASAVPRALYARMRHLRRVRGD